MNLEKQINELGITDLVEQIENAYIAGFMSSGEGDNGEYSHRNIDEYSNKYITKLRKLNNESRRSN